MKDDIVSDLFDAFDELKIAVEDYERRIRWLLDTYKLWDEQGCFCFPDGEIWNQHRRKSQ